MQSPTGGTQYPTGGTQYPNMQPCAAGVMPTAAAPCLMQNSGSNMNTTGGSQYPMGSQSGNMQQPGMTGGTFFCQSLNRQATGPECDAADTAKGILHQSAPQGTNGPMGQTGSQNFQGPNMNGPNNQTGSQNFPQGPNMNSNPMGQQNFPQGPNMNPPPPMFQPPMYGIFGPPMGPGQYNQGPNNGQPNAFGAQDEERMQQQQAQQEEQFKKMQEQQVKQIKKELGRMKKEIDRVRKQLDTVKVTDNTPEEVVTAKQAIAEIDAAMTEVDTCSGDECFDIMPTVGPLMQDIMNPSVMQALQRIKEGPKFAKRLVAEIKKTVKKTTSVAKSLSEKDKNGEEIGKVKNIKDLNIRDALTAEIDETMTQCGTLAAQAIDLANGGDIESAALTVENELYDACGAVSDLRLKIDGFVSKQKVLKSIDRVIRSLTSRLTKFQRDIQNNRFNGDLDAVSQLAVIIPELSDKLVEIKQEKDIDTLGDLFDDAAGLISDAEEFVQDAQVQNIANQFDMFRAPATSTQPTQEDFSDTGF